MAQINCPSILDDKDCFHDGDTNLSIISVRTLCILITMKETTIMMKCEVSLYPVYDCKYSLTNFKSWFWGWWLVFIMKIKMCHHESLWISYWPKDISKKLPATEEAPLPRLNFMFLGISIWNIKILQSQYQKQLSHGIYQNLGISIKTLESWNLKKDIKMLEYQYERFKILTSIMLISLWDFTWSEPPQQGQRCEIALCSQIRIVAEFVLFWQKHRPAGSFRDVMHV